MVQRLPRRPDPLPLPVTDETRPPFGSRLGSPAPRLPDAASAADIPPSRQFLPTPTHPQVPESSQPDLPSQGLCKR